MKIPSIFNKKSPIDCYKKLRQAGRELNTVLIKELPKSVILKYGKKLGMVKGKTLLLDNEDELSILFDHCLFNYRRNGKTIMAHYLENFPPPAGSDEMTLLKAMCASYYSIFGVEEIQKGKGAILHDVLRAHRLFLMDLSIAKSAVPGIMFAGRVLTLADFHMTSGAFIPLQGKMAEKKILPIVKKFLPSRSGAEGDFLFSPAQEAEFSAQVIRTSLKAGALNSILYMDVE